MPLRLPRFLGAATSLSPGEWSDFTASGAAAICCSGCGGIFEIAPPEYVISKQGEVTPAWRCPTETTETCGVVEWIELAAYGEDVVR